MAENDRQERTEQPTQKRLDEARRQGDIPRSRELSAAAVTIVGAAGLYFFGDQFGAGLYDLMRDGLSPSPDAIAYEPDLPRIAGAALSKAALLCAPIFGLVALAAMLAPLTLGGWSFSSEALAPKWDRLNPASGVKRMFSSAALVELVKSLAKFAVIAIAALLLLKQRTGELLSLGSEPTRQAVLHACKVFGQAFIVLSCGLLLIAAVDAPYQLWQYGRKLRMTRQEIREEMKESEGSPEIKGRVRRMQQEMARRRMMQQVPKADVVVTNPTHYAVALRYDENRMRAPIVVAKGVDEVAAKIRETAEQHRVPLFEAPPLARALHRHVELGQEIPQRLYVAVAQVLTYIFQLRAAKNGLSLTPERPDIAVSEE